MRRGAHRTRSALLGPGLLLASACLASSSSQLPVDAGGTSASDGGGPIGDGAPYKGTCDTAATWQVVTGGTSGGATLTFVVPQSAANGGSWTPATGLTYSFDATTCTVSLTSAGCPGGTFDLATRACTVLTEAICEASACDAGCPSQTTACTLSGL
jgi:hypothetical protein